MKAAKLPVSRRWRFVAHPKLSHLLSQWVSWAQGVWDAAVCWGRGKVCGKKIKRLCVGEAKKNITAWQHCCREWRTWRRSVGEKGKGTPGWVRGRVWQRGRWEWCVRVCVRWGNIYGRVVRSYCFLPVFSRSGWGWVVGPAGRDRGRGRRGWRETGRQVVGGGGLSQHWVNTGRLGWVGGCGGWRVLRDGPRCSRLSLQAAPTLRPRSGRTGSHEPACPPLSLSHLLNKSTVFLNIC